MKYVLALDQGTTSSRSILVDLNGNIAGIEQQEFKQIFPRSGWVEHDPEEIWLSQLSTMRKLLRNSKATVDDIAAIGITNQRETTVLWDRNSGQPVGHAIVWQDRRTASICDQLVKDGHGDMIRSKTGLVTDAYFSGTKVKWLLDNIEGVRDRAERGEICFGTVDSWLIYRLTGGRVHVTDVTNASRTMLFNIHTLEWDEDLLELLDIPSSLLPAVRPSSGDFGITDERVLGKEIPICGVAGDQQAALFGQQCTQAGMAKNTYGTGCFMLMNTGEKAVRSDSGLLTTIAWGIDGTVEYALEGSVFVAGAAIQWLRDGLGIIETAQESQELARSVEDNDDVYFVPALSGLGTPYWDMAARGTIVGITRGTTQAHLVRAALEAIAYRTAEVLDVMKKDGGIELHELRVDGGAAVNDFLMQFQADVLGVPVVRPRDTESTALGAAFLAGLSAGIWSKEELRDTWNEERRFIPEISESSRSVLMARWKEAVQRSAGWAR